MKKLVFLLFCVSIFMVACDQKVDNVGGGEPVKEVNDVPVSFTESSLGVGRELPEYLSADNPYIVIKATTKEDHAKYWKDLGIKGETKEVDFAKNDVYYITTFGSSSCPTEFKEFVTSEEVLKLTIADLKADAMCTMDYVANTSVMLVNKDASKQITTVSFDAKESSTSVKLWVK